MKFGMLHLQCVTLTYFLKVGIYTAVMTPVSEIIFMLGDKGNSDEIQILTAGYILKVFYKECKRVNRLEETTEFLSFKNQSL